VNEQSPADLTPPESDDGQVSPFDDLKPPGTAPPDGSYSIGCSHKPVQDPLATSSDCDQPLPITQPIETPIQPIDPSSLTLAQRLEHTKLVGKYMRLLKKRLANYPSTHPSLSVTGSAQGDTSGLVQPDATVEAVVNMEGRGPAAVELMETKSCLVTGEIKVVRSMKATGSGQGTPRGSTIPPIDLPTQSTRTNLLSQYRKGMGQCVGYLILSNQIGGTWMSFFLLGTTFLRAVMLPSSKTIAVELHPDVLRQLGTETGTLSMKELLSDHRDLIATNMAHDLVANYSSGIVTIDEDSLTTLRDLLKSGIDLVLERQNNRPLARWEGRPGNVLQEVIKRAGQCDASREEDKKEFMVAARPEMAYAQGAGDKRKRAGTGVEGEDKDNVDDDHEGGDGGGDVEGNGEGEGDGDGDPGSSTSQKRKEEENGRCGSGGRGGGNQYNTAVEHRREFPCLSLSLLPSSSTPHPAEMSCSVPIETWSQYTRWIVVEPSGR